MKFLPYVLFLAWSFLPLPTLAASDTGTMYCSDGAHTSRYDDGGRRPNNKLRWQYNTGTAAFYTQPVIADGVIYFSRGGTPVRLVAVNMRDGSLKWLSDPIPSSQAIGTAAVMDDYVVVTGSAVFALRKDTGELAWTNDTAIPYDSSAHYPGSPTVYHNVIYVPDSGQVGGFVAAILPDGTTHWRKGWDDWEIEQPPPAGRGAGIWGFNALTAVNGTLYISAAPRLVAVDAGSGGGHGRDSGDTFSNSFNNHAPAYANGRLYIPLNYHGLGCYEPTTLERLWLTPMVRTNSNMIQATVGDGLVFAGSSNSSVTEIMAVDALTGERRWDISLGAAGTIYDPMAYANGVLYVATNTRRMWAINAADGSVLWTFDTGQRLFGPPAVADGSVFIAGHDGTTSAVLFAIGTSGGARPALPAIQALLLGQ